jgi:hypothetical protein
MSDVEDACGPTSVGRVGLRVGAIFVILVRPRGRTLLSVRVDRPSFPGDFCLWDHVPDPFEAGTVPAESDSRLALRLCQVSARRLDGAFWPNVSLLFDLPRR